jgi:hypothetical protein
LNQDKHQQLVRLLQTLLWWLKRGAHQPYKWTHAHVITEANWMQLVLLGIQYRTSAPYLAAIPGILISVAHLVPFHDVHERGMLLVEYVLASAEQEVRSLSRIKIALG